MPFISSNTGRRRETGPKLRSCFWQVAMADHSHVPGGELPVSRAAKAHDFGDGVFGLERLYPQAGKTGGDVFSERLA